MGFGRDKLEREQRKPAKQFGMFLLMISVMDQLHILTDNYYFVKMFGDSMKYLGEWVIQVE
jgi:hypothetical protein